MKIERVWPNWDEGPWDSDDWTSGEVESQLFDAAVHSAGIDDEEIHSDQLETVAPDIGVLPAGGGADSGCAVDDRGDLDGHLSRFDSDAGGSSNLRRDDGSRPSGAAVSDLAEREALSDTGTIKRNGNTGNRIQRPADQDSTNERLSVSTILADSETDPAAELLRVPDRGAGADFDTQAVA
jgi:hypothetical protein